MKVFHLLFLIFSLFVSPQSLLAQPWTGGPKKSCPSNLSNEKVFEILMQAEFAGVQLDGANPNCLSEDKFPHQSVSPDFAQDEVELKLYLVEKPKLTIKSFTLEDKFQNIYTVQFSIIAKNQTTNKEEEVEDSAMITIFNSDRLKRLHGCGNFLERPKNIYIRPQCLPKE
jgi:hypothetical protein